MPDRILPNPTRTDLKQHVLTALNVYWKRDSEHITELPVGELTFPTVNTALKLQHVDLPDWAYSCSVSGQLLVPAEACGDGTDWRNVDWWLACFLLIEGWHERVHEQRYGTIHSYSFRLKGWDDRVWSHAWVNRIAIFLRLWAAEQEGVTADSLFGPIPKATVLMTHDVDAVKKTIPIRIKQSVFNLLKASRHISEGKWAGAGHCLRRALRFLFGRENWWMFDDMLEIEEKAGIRSRFHFYADHRRKSVRRWLFDPGYDVTGDRIRSLIGRLDAGGWRTGLHQSYDAWQSSSLISAQRERLEMVSSTDINSCRQHWLRFSWRDTWAAQETAGLKEDTTLMFNDRMGFRSAAAVAWNPWNQETARSHGMRAVPTVLMDSHAYDYTPLTDEQRRSEFRRWFAEIEKVGGRCAVLWHPHTLTPDYGWKAGYRDCIDLATEMDICLCH